MFALLKCILFIMRMGVMKEEAGRTGEGKEIGKKSLKFVLGAL